jgi:hypothetical protein
MEATTPPEALRSEEKNAICRRILVIMIVGICHVPVN